MSLSLTYIGKQVLIPSKAMQYSNFCINKITCGSKRFKAHNNDQERPYKS